MHNDYFNSVNSVGVSMQDNWIKSQSSEQRQLELNQYSVEKINYVHPKFLWEICY